MARFLFNVYMQTPFLFETRTILDWVASHTSLDLFMWFTLAWTRVTFFRNYMVMAARTVGSFHLSSFSASLDIQFFRVWCLGFITVLIS